MARSILTVLLFLLLGASPVLSWPLWLSSITDLVARQLPGNLLSPYAPTTGATCPKQLLRGSRAVSPDELAWVAKRKAKATKNFKKFLKRTGDFPVLANSQYPTMALSTGGGGLRGFLTGAGLHKAFDGREGNVYTTSGLYQSMTYESALSGSSLMLASYANNGQPLTDKIYNELWKQAFVDGLFSPDGQNGKAAAFAQITKDVVAKASSGFMVSVLDILGRLFAYSTLLGEAGGVKKKLSATFALPNYKKHNFPFPIYSALGIETDGDGCGLPPKDATQYEFTPVEFGSFDKDISAFVPTKYMGTSVNNGKLANPLQGCVTGFDNMAFVIGTSTNLLNQNCGQVKYRFQDIISQAGAEVLQGLQGQVVNVLGEAIQGVFSFIPNPAYKYPKATKTNSMSYVKLIDGGENIQVNPIWAFLHRPDIKVIFVNDNSADNGTNFPNGRQIHNTFLQSKAQGVQDRMPTIPIPKVFAKHGYNRKPAAFGCNEPPHSKAATFIWVPNTKYTYNSGQKTNRTRYDAKASRAMIDNGVQVATIGEDPDWGFCVGCVAMKRSVEAAGKALPSGCSKCFKRLCYN